MATGEIFQIIPTFRDCKICYMGSSNPQFDDMLNIHLYHYTCNCPVPVEEPHENKVVYINAMRRHCLVCMNQYQFADLHDGRLDRFSCMEINKYYNRSIYDRDIISLQSGIMSCAKWSYIEHAIDIIIHTIHSLHYSINKLYIAFPKATTIENLQILINYCWLPTDKFLEPYKCREHIKTLIELRKRILTSNYKRMVARSTVRKAASRIKKCIKQYSTMRTNLYIMVRGNLLCYDIAEYIEKFIY